MYFKPWKPVSTNLDILSFMPAGQIMTFQGKLKLKDFMRTKAALKKILKESYSQKNKINSTLSTRNLTRRIDKKWESRNNLVYHQTFKMYKTERNEHRLFKTTRRKTKW